MPLFISCRSSGEKLIKCQAICSCVIMSLILMTTLFYKALILQGEIWCWSLLRLKGLMITFLKHRKTVRTIEMYSWRGYIWIWNIWIWKVKKPERHSRMVLVLEEIFIISYTCYIVFIATWFHIVFFLVSGVCLATCCHTTSVNQRTLKKKGINGYF